MTMPQPFPSEVVSACCDVLGISWTDFAGKGRDHECLAAREMCVLLLKEHTSLSFPEIARAMGRPNHSTIITIYKRPEKRFTSEQLEDAEGRIKAMVSARWSGLTSEDEARLKIQADRLARADSRLAELRRVNRQQEDDVRRKIAEQKEQALRATRARPGFAALPSLEVLMERRMATRKEYA